MGKMYIKPSMQTNNIRSKIIERSLIIFYEKEFTADREKHIKIWIKLFGWGIGIFLGKRRRLLDKTVNLASSIWHQLNIGDKGFECGPCEFNIAFMR